MTVTTRQIALSLRTAIEAALFRYNLPGSETAVRLLLMIAAHESGQFLYCRQRGGPALGLFQMEPKTYAGVLEWLERTGKFPAVQRNLPAARLVTDPAFAAAIARVYLYMAPPPLPGPDELQAMAEYAKRHWNTYLGAATPADYLNAYLAVNGQQEPAA